MNESSLSRSGKKYSRDFMLVYNDMETLKPLNYNFLLNLAVNVLNLDGSERENLVGTLWTKQFIDLLVSFIVRKDKYWMIMLISIGNSIAVPIEKIPFILLENKSFVEFISKLLSCEDPDAHAPMETGRSAQECAAWILTNIIQSREGTVLPQLFPFIPVLLHCCHTSEEPGLSIPCFRGLCSIFNNKETQRQFPEEYISFRELVLTSNLLPVLLEEYQFGLEGKAVPGTSFYPNAFDRALTVQYLSSVDEFQDRLIDCKIIELLLKSLVISYARTEKETFLLWSRAIKSLHNLMRSFRRKQNYYLLFTSQEMIGCLSNIATGRHAENSEENSDLSSLSFSGKSNKARMTPIIMQIPMKTRFLATDMVIALGMKWDIQRLFWIVQRKPQPMNCYLRRLPAELLRVILKWLVLLGGFFEKDRFLVQEVRLGYKR
jgi:hypothetical protein